MKERNKLNPHRERAEAVIQKAKSDPGYFKILRCTVYEPLPIARVNIEAVFHKRALANQHRKEKSRIA